MKQVTFFAAAAAVTVLVASPVLAQDSMQPRAAKHMNAKHMKQHHASNHYMRHQARAYRTDEMTSRDDWSNRDTGFWPADVVGGAVGTAGAIAGAAVGTAGAIATAPFGGPYRDSYAYGGPRYGDGYAYDGVAIPYSANYAARNGFVCQPGTITRAKNGSGVPVICQ